MDSVSPAALEEHNQAILRAIICAAKADGHIDDRERQLIDAIAKLTNEPQLQSWFQQELRKPLDPADLARVAKTPEIAAKIHLARFLWLMRKVMWSAPTLTNSLDNCNLGQP